MTDTLGRRLARLRKQVGVTSTRELSDRTGGRVSESVLQNIESGRRTDLAVSQLLEIAFALRISPVMLLAPMERPLETIDLPDVGPELAALTAAEFDQWFAGSDTQPIERLWLSDVSTSAVLQLLMLKTVRRLVPDLEELAACDEELRRIDAGVDRAGDADLVQQEVAQYAAQGLSWREGMKQDLLLEQKQLRERIDRNADALVRQGYSADWVPRPWHDQDER